MLAISPAQHVVTSTVVES